MENKERSGYIFLNPAPVLQNKHLIIMLKNAITSVENKKLSADNFLSDSFVKLGQGARASKLAPTR